MPREALRLRRTDRQGAGLRPADAAPVTQWDSALRSDYVYIDAPLGKEETLLNVDNIGYDSADVRFNPAAVITANQYATYGLPDAYSIVRSPAGVPVTNQDGAQIARFDFTAARLVSTRQRAGTLVTLVTAAPHLFTAGQSVTVLLAAADVGLNGTFTIVGTPTTTSFTYNTVATGTIAVGATTGTAIVRNTGATPLQPGQSVRVVDTGLMQGQWYYYGLFGRYFYQGNTYWFRLANSELLVPVDYGYKAKLWGAIPEFYRRLDEEHEGAYVGSGVLRRLIDTLGYECDVQRTWNATLGDLWDVERVNARLLPKLGAVLGHGSPEAALGDRRYRTLLANIMHLRKIRGTKDGIEGWLSAVTGYKVLVYVGKNLLLTNDDTELRSGQGSWVNIATGTIARVTSAGEIGGPSSTEFYLRLTNSTGGTITSSLRSTNLIPVVAGHQYRMSYMVRSTVARTTSWTATWFDATNASLGVVTDSSVPTTTGWAQFTGGWLTAPANAVWLQVTLNGPGMLNTEAISYWKMMLVDSTWQPTGQPALYTYPPTSYPSATYEAARMVHVSLYPQRTNFAINSDFAANPGAFPAQGWANTDPATYGALLSAYATYAAIVTLTITSMALTGGVATLATTAAMPGGPVALHGLKPGDVITTSGIGGGGTALNGTFTVLATPTPSTFTYTVPSPPADFATTATGLSGSSNVTSAPETTYADLLAELDTLVNTTALTFVPIGSPAVLGAPGYMTMTSSASPYIARSSSQYFPVVGGAPYSARVMVSASIADVQVVLRIRFYTSINGVFTEIVGTDVTGPTTTASVYNGALWVNVPVVVNGATAPAAATFARAVIESQGSPTPGTSLYPGDTTFPSGLLFPDSGAGAVVASYTLYVTYAIIEDNVMAGPYFDGRTTEGAFGDFRFTGTPGASFSAYYQNFNAVMNGLSNADRLHSLLPSVIPADRDYTIHSVLNGLL